jgi:UTP--glucose-1-phosphate uridylyltransferase
MDFMTIKKAVFPVAGMGTRFLPATKANPKEMLPIVDKPLIQYAVEEAIAAGITELIFVTSSSKRAIEDHFDSNFELENKLAEQGKNELLDIVQGILPKGVNCCYVRQRMPLGLGHAVLCAKEIIGNEPFAVLLADDLIDADQPCLKQMLQAHNENLQASVIAVEKISAEDSKKYGVVKVDNKDSSAIKQIQDIVEKPEPSKAPSNWGVVGRYILTPKIFTLLETTQRGSGGEIQLTDAIASLLKYESVYAQRFEGQRYDCGNKFGYLEATVNYALKHPEVKERFQALLQKQESLALEES